MAIGWLTVLKTVPWGDVLANAPKVADGAKKLWNSVGKTPATPESSPPAAPAASGSDSQVMAELRTRLVALEAAGAALHEQMLASSQLIKALAEQNAELIEGMAANRIRIVWLARATLVTGIIAVFALTLALLR